MKCYSPEPHSKYAFVLSPDFTYQPAEGNLVAWNLVWLSIPKVDDMLLVPRNVSKFFDEIDAPGIGELSALSHFFEGSASVKELMGPSPVAFVRDFVDAFDLPKRKVWSHFGGQAWIDIMTARAYQSEGLAHVYEAAEKATNVILADFTAKRRMV